MISNKKLFPSQEKEERIFLLIRKHWFNYVLFVLLAFLMIMPVIIFLIYVNFINPALISTQVAYIGSVLIISSYLLAIIGLQLYGIVDFYLDVYIVTDRRIVDIRQDGFFKRQISELHLRQVQDVNAKVEGFFPTMLHFGDVHIQTAGEQENFVFQLIPHPYTVAKEIINLHECHIENDDHSICDSSFQKDENNAGKGLPFYTPEQEKNNGNGASMSPVVGIKETIRYDNITPKLNTALNSVNNKTVNTSSVELKEGQEVNIS